MIESKERRSERGREEDSRQRGRKRERQRERFTSLRSSGENPQLAEPKHSLLALSTK
jgi:hypothetical protein